MPKECTRRRFLGFAAVFAGANAFESAPGGFARSRAGANSIEPDLAVINGRVFTLDNAQPRADAFAIKNGRFVAVGSGADIKNLVLPGTQVIDAGGMTVLPGLIDAHCHPSGVEELYSVNLNLRTIGEIQEALRKKAAQTQPGYWVEGFMFDDTKLNDGRPLHRKDLDQAVPDHPVSVAHRGGHTNWYNGKAFELAGITRNAPDPADGRFFHDEDGELSGKVAELARNVFRKAGKRETYTPEQQRERARAGMRHISELLTAAGLTTVHDASANRGRIQAYEDTYRNGELRHRAYMMIQAGETLAGLKAAGIYTGFGDEWVRVGGAKFLADGSASERTMRMSTPYAGTNDYGILTMTQQQIHDAVEDAHRHNFQVGIHANGDVAIDMVLKAYERVQEKWPYPDRRHRIEHCSLVNPDLLKRIKAGGFVPTPFWTYVYYHGEKWGNYGEEKMKWMFAHRSFLDYGIPVPGASDYTPGPFEPMMALQSMVTRKDFKGRLWGANQKVTVDEALRIATLHGAYASGEEKLKGSITAGKLADFVIVEKDPHDVAQDQIKDIKIVRTVVGGRTVYPKS
jgi:predicted amidohydrolase YtcJ